VRLKLFLANGSATKSPAGYSKPSGCKIRYDFTTHIATCKITLTGDTIDAVAQTSQETIAGGPAEHATGHHQAVGGRAGLSPPGDGLCCAPSRIRTCAHGSGGRCSIP
jgi:hypothetical protein